MFAYGDATEHAPDQDSPLPDFNMDVAAYFVSDLLKIADASLRQMQRNRIEAAEAMEAASKLADAGNVEGGRAQIRAISQRICGSASAGNAQCASLVRECAELEQAFCSREVYRSIGAKSSKMASLSHMRQRAVHSSAGDAYAGGAKRKATMKASWAASLKLGHVSSGDDSD